MTNFCATPAFTTIGQLNSTESDSVYVQLSCKGLLELKQVRDTRQLGTVA